MRENPLITGEVYHIFNKSIADFIIFNHLQEYERMILAIRYYMVKEHDNCLARFLESNQKEGQDINTILKAYLNEKPKLVDLIAYCIMPTHIHFILKQLQQNGISTFINNLLNSYTRYFNRKHKRKGPLLEGRFKSVIVKDDEQLLHLTRYIHLNPATAFLTNKPESWVASSYKEYLQYDALMGICNFRGILNISPHEYKKFTENRISYQRELAKIKELVVENPL